MQPLAVFTAVLPLLGAVSAAKADPASTFAQLQLLSYDERVEAYGDLPHADQRAYWVGKVEAFKSEHLDSLNPTQEEALNSAIRVFRSADELRDEEPAMGREVVAAFGHQKANELLATLYNDGESEDVSGDSTADEEKADTENMVCHCNAESEWTCGGYPHAGKCILDLDACEHVFGGCGGGMIWECNGRCIY